MTPTAASPSAAPPSAAPPSAAPPSAASPTARPAAARGVALCLVSASAFGLAAAIATEAGAAGVTLPTLLTGRFALAALVFAAVARVRGAAFPRGRLLATCVALGAVGYAAQSSLYFGALRHLDATLAGLLLYAYPPMVVGLAVALGRERADRRVLAALACSLTGLALLLGGGAASAGGGSAALGVAMALGAALTYALYVTVAAGLLQGLDLFAMSAVICAAAAAVIGAGGAATGALSWPTGEGWAWIATLAAVATVVAVGSLFAGVRLVGASKASLLSCAEPVVTAVVAIALYGEVLTPTRLAGGAAVLASVLVAESRSLSRARRRSLAGRPPSLSAPPPSLAHAPQ